MKERWTSRASARAGASGGAGGRSGKRRRLVIGGGTFEDEVVFVGEVIDVEGFEAAEGALAAVFAGCGVGAGIYADVAGGEVCGEGGEDCAPGFELDFEGDFRFGGGCGDDAALSVGCEGKANAGAEGGEGDAGGGWLGGDGVEGELRFFRALVEPLDGFGFAGFVVEDEGAGGGLVDAVYAEFEVEGADFGFELLLHCQHFEGMAFEFYV